MGVGTMFAMEWIYEIEQVAGPELPRDTCNRMGAAGWELAGVTMEHKLVTEILGTAGPTEHIHTWVLFFKKPLS
jgi:hypothetical protein